MKDLVLYQHKSGSQPCVSENENQVLSVNGEIYNCKSLYSNVLLIKYTNQSLSDCEVTCLDFRREYDE